MKRFLRILGLLIVLTSIVALCLIQFILMPPSYTQFFTLLFGYLLALFLPGLLIDLVYTWLEKRSGIDIGTRCGGLPSGGYLIGYTERSLIFLSLMITYFDSALSYVSILSFLSVIVAGKAIFRYSSKETSDRACADWYILGTLLSIGMALALSWGIFRFLLIG